MRFRVCLVTLAAAGCLGGCSSVPVRENPGTVANANYEQVWDTTIRVLENYFEIGRSSRFDGFIELKPLTGATLFEPWRHDAVDPRERLEATLQTIRRTGYVLVQPAPTGGFAVTVEVYKELENLSRPAFSSFGGGTLVAPVQALPEGVVTSAIQPAEGWISLGRDLKLEGWILRELQHELDGI